MGLIRLLLALSVIASHEDGIFGLKFVGGPIAVQSFFIISGFYMSLILNEKYIGANHSYKLFVTNRLIRLYPVYWTVLLATVLFCIIVGLTSRGHYFLILANYFSFNISPSSLLYLISTNIFLFFQDLTLFLGLNPSNGNLFFTPHFQNSIPPVHSFLFIPQAWSLGVELSFYLIAPFILTRGIKLVTCLIILSFLLRLLIYNYFQLQDDPWRHRFFPTELMFFLLGYLSYQIYLRMKIGEDVKIFINVFVIIFSVIFTLCFEYIPSLRISWLPFSVNELVYFSTIVFSIPVLFSWLKNSQLDRKIGDLSYPVYISHLSIGLVFSIVVYQLPNLSFLNKGWAIAIATILFAYVLNKWIANPVEKYRQARLKKQ